jgi:hypothetical protein
MTVPAQLALVFDLAAATDSELADELYDATLLLSMGSEGINADVAAGLHGRRLAAARELLRRWEPEP